MYPTHWGLQHEPFRDALSGGWWHETVQEEALARLQFLIEQHRSLGLLIGPAGCGKSLLLSVFGRQLRAAGRPAASVSLLGRDVDELLWELAAQFGCNPGPAASRPRLWRTLTDRLTEHRYQQTPHAILLDDADRADSQVLEAVLRLCQWASSAATPTTFVLAARPERLLRLGYSLADLAELRIDLVPWEVDETDRYLRQALAQAGCRREIFAAEAVARLHELTEGVPRRVHQLAELALLAGAGQALPQIDAEVVEAVYRELAPAASV